MKIIDFIYDLEHAERYLTNIVAMKGKTPCYINAVGRTGRSIMLYYLDLLEQTAHAEALNNEWEINYKLGYVNFIPSSFGISFNKQSVVRAVRLPIRAAKLGIFMQNVSIRQVRVEHSSPRTDYILKSKDFGKALANMYPSFEESLATDCITAFDRSFAVDTKKNIYYRSIEGVIGQFQNNLILLKEEYDYLKEELSEKTGVPCPTIA